MFYIVTAQVHEIGIGGFERSTQVPTFFLDSDVQGITGREHAANIVQDILRSINRTARFSFHVEEVTS